MRKKEGGQGRSEVKRSFPSFRPFLYSRSRGSRGVETNAPTARRHASGAKDASAAHVVQKNSATFL